MTQVFVLGMAAVDFVFSVPAMPRTAEKYLARDAKVVGGGPAANAAVAVARLGGTPELAARLGDDALAGLVLQGLEADGVATNFVNRAPDGQSSFSSVYVDAQGERQIVNFRGTGLTEDTFWLADATRADAVLVDTRWPSGALRALDMARTWGVPGVLDAEAPIDPSLLEKASHVAFSRTGLQQLSNENDPARALKEAAAGLEGWACVTDGERGVWFTDGTGIAHVPAFQVIAKDTLAAGDIWHGAFALSLAEERDALTAIRFANAAAALKCMNFGGRAGCPDRAAVNSFLKENT
ncbi:MAG: sulfofructose kinase [Akkermansiaceae bacterium]|jgi:sulfofructose kinase